jgi:apolipoprotein N-acyltransferase
VPAGRPDARFVVPPVLSALLLALAQPPFHVLPLAFLALAPLAAGLASLPPGPGGESRASLQGAIFGLAFWGISLSWIPLVVGRHFSWALPAYGLLLGLLAGLSALFAWAVHRLRYRAGLPLALGVPLAWVGVEWIRAHFPLGLAFPWLGLGATLTPRPWLLGVAEWTGESGVAFWLALASGWVAGKMVRIGGRRGRSGVGGFHWRRWLPLGESKWRPGPSPDGPGRERRPQSGGIGSAPGAQPGDCGSASRPQPGRQRAGPTPVSGRSRAYRVLVATALLAPPLLGWGRARTLPLHPGPTLAVVGTGVPRELRSDPGASAREAMSQIRAALRSPTPFPPTDLILLPEATVPLPLEGQEARLLREEIGLLAAQAGTPLVVGALGWVPAGAGSNALTNSAYLVLADGTISHRYDKARLVPGMEAGAYRPGTGRRILESDGWVFGPLVCYESLFGGLARKARQEGAHALLNLTSDIWFGDGESFVGSMFLRQHPAHLVLRAVENRMPVARAANGGLSFLLDPLGRISSPVVPPEGGVVRAQLSTTPGMTVFTRVGDLVGPASALLTLLLLLWARRREVPA